MKVKGMAKKWRYPEASERDFSRSLQGAVSQLIDHLRRKTRSIKFDDISDEINQAEQENDDLTEELIAALIALLPMLALNIYRFNSKQWIMLAASIGGRNNPAVRTLDLLGATAGEDWYQPLRNAWIDLARQSVRKLMSNITSDWLTTVRTATLAMKNQEQVETLVDQRFKVYHSWGKNRASGVIGTWNSRLMRQRIIDSGVRFYIWRGVMDEREREKHVKLEGRKIAIDADHIFPGEEYNCRCWAVPYFPDVNSYNNWRGKV